MDSSAAELGLIEETCPFCGSKQPYILGDGRRKCRSCRVKYTPLRRPGRLDDALIQRLAGHFWRMDSIDLTAGQLDLDRKTVQRYFGLLRRAIAERGERRAAMIAAEAKIDSLYLGRLSPLGGVKRQDTVTVFGQAVRDGLVYLIMAAAIADWSGLDLRGLRRVGHDGRPLADEDNAFWPFARQRLKHYRGGYKKQLPLYLREMEFRFNHRDDPAVMQKLAAMLAARPR